MSTKLGEGIRKLASTGEPFTADDLVALVGIPDASHSANSRNSSLGAVFSWASKSGLIRPTGRVVQSSQPHRKGGMIREWIGNEAP